MDKVEKDEIKEYVFGFECSAGWENLEKTDDEKRRFCRQCKKNVYFARTQTELNDIAAKGHCAAFPNPDLSPIKIRPQLAGYVLPPFKECQVCKKLIHRKDFDMVKNICLECKKTDSSPPPPQKSWWQF